MHKLGSEQFSALVKTICQVMRNHNFEVTARTPIDYGMRLEFIGGMLNVYNGKRGPSAVPAGKLSEAEKQELAAMLKDVIPVALAAGAATAPTANAPGNVFQHAEPWIGCDESGKGDYFGPLVVAAVLVRPEDETELLKAGIRDSKTLTDTRALALSGWIEARFPCAVEILTPEIYNQRYAGNLNTLLSQLHAQVIATLAKAHQVASAISDRFGRSDLIEKELIRHGAAVRLISVPKAEADIAVAAASVLARGLFLDGLKQLSSDAGMRLPAGAGPQVVDAARELVRLFGRRGGAEALKRFAKWHFKTTASVLEREGE